MLRGGTRATVWWSAESLPPFVEEWEAFLSVDGGKFYAYRITPHLEADLRQFTFEVPNVETDQARILIRAGDERREPARAGGRGGVEWIDGDRDGSHLTPHSARHRPLTVHAMPAAGLHAESCEEPAVRFATAPRAAASPATFAAELSPIRVASGHRTDATSFSPTAASTSSALLRSVPLPAARRRLFPSRHCCAFVMFSVRPPHFVRRRLDPHRTNSQSNVSFPVGAVPNVTLNSVADRAVTMVVVCHVHCTNTR